LSTAGGPFWYPSGWLLGRCGWPLLNAQAGGFQFVEHVLGHVERLVFGDR